MIEEDGTIRNDCDTENVLNTFFLNNVRNLKIPEYTTCDPLFEKNSDPFLKSIVKYRNHPNILKIGEVCHSNSATNFSFSIVQRKQILKEITRISLSKLGHSTDTPTKIITPNSGIFADFILISFNQSIANSVFHLALKKQI